MEFYFRFRSRPFSGNTHVILYPTTEFRPNRSRHCGHMTSYPFIIIHFMNMAATSAKYYFRFRNLLMSLPSEVKVYQQTKFRQHISIHSWDKTTSVFWKNKRPPYWNSTSGFALDHFAVICMSFCVRLSCKSGHPLRKYDIISISEDGGRDR